MPTEPSAKIRISPIETFATSPLMYQPLTVQPGPNGMTANAASAVNALITGAMMYGTSTALDGQYTAFGRVVDGMAAVEAIEALPRNGETPLSRIELKTVGIQR